MGSIKVVVGVAVVILAGAGAIGVYFDLEELLIVVVVIIAAPLVWVAGVQTMVLQEGVEMGVPMGWPILGVVPTAAAAKLFVDKGW